MLILRIHNDGTGTEEIGNYDCEVKINTQTIATIRVEGHRRADGWRSLVLGMLIADAIERRGWKDL